jgi:hypothetical protein
MVAVPDYYMKIFICIHMHLCCWKAVDAYILHWMLHQRCSKHDHVMRTKNSVRDPTIKTVPVPLTVRGTVKLSDPATLCATHV